MKKEVLIASSNLNKAKELTAISAEFGIQLILPNQLIFPNQLSGSPPKVEENGKDYFENSLIKARAYHQWSGMPVISDDSGLEVEILNNRPGVLSARYGENLSQAEKNKMLIREVLEAEEKQGQKNRKANFCCSIILYFSEDKYFHQTERLWGQILDSSRGEGGFGYDPIVMIDSIGKTLAEVDFNITTSIGFRSIAGRKLLNGLDPSVWLVS